MSKRGTGGSKRVTRESKRGTRKSKRGTRESKRGAGGSKMSTRRSKRATGDYKKGTRRSKRGTGGSKRAHLEVEKARLGGARVEKEIKTPRYQKPSKTDGHFDLENWCKYTCFFHTFPDLSIHKNLHGAYTGAQFMTFKLVQKTMQNHHKNEDKNNIEKKRFPGSLPHERAGQEVYPNIKGGDHMEAPPINLRVLQKCSLGDAGDHVKI